MLERALWEVLFWAAPVRTTSRAPRAQASRIWAGSAQAGSPAGTGSRVGSLVGSPAGSRAGWTSSRRLLRSAMCSTEETATPATKASMEMAGTAGVPVEVLPVVRVAATTEATQVTQAAARLLTSPPRHRRAMSSARMPEQQQHTHVRAAYVPFILLDIMLEAYWILYDASMVKDPSSAELRFRR